MVFLPSFLAFLAFFTVGSAFREAKDEEFPFQVSVQTTDKRYICGGAIITPKWVLTASSCLTNLVSVYVCYGSADYNNPVACTMSSKIYHENNFNLHKQRRLALIELEKSVEFSNTVKPAKLPTSKVQLRNTTKACGWKLNLPIDTLLYVSDTYYVVPENCKTTTGVPVALDLDEFCGMDEKSQNLKFNLGTTVSKNAIVVGILTEIPQAQNHPCIYIKLSEHVQWIKDVLQADAQHINWVDEVPKDSANLHCTVSLALLGMSTLFIRLL